MPDDLPIKSRAIAAILQRLNQGLLNPDLGDLALRGSSIRRGVTVEDLMGVYPSAILLDGPESVSVPDGSTRGEAITFALMIKLALGPANNADPVKVDRYCALVQQVMERGGEEADGDGSGFKGLEVREADGTVICWITGGGEATPFHQATDGASVVGAMVTYEITYRRVFGNPWKTW